MEISINKVHSWSDHFFTDFLKAKIQLESGNIGQYINPTLMDFKNEFLSPYFLNNKVQFEAIILRCSDGRPVGQVVLYYKPKISNEVIFGHFNVIDSQEVMSLLVEEMDKFAKKMSAQTIKGPMQGHFFFSYRLKIWGKDSFFSEPIHPEFYAKRLEENGFAQFKKWETSEIDVKKTRQNFTEIRRSSRKQINKFRKLKIKYIFPWRWNRYMKHILDLFNETYREMDGFEELDFLTFKMNYDSFKYLINPFLSYLVTYKGKPVGFCINYLDPHELIYNFQESKSLIPEKIRMILLIMKLLINRKRLLITYVGRLDKVDGEELKGVQSLVSKHLGFYVWLFRIKQVFVCYRAEESAANRSFDKNNENVIAEYGMYQRVVKAIQ